MGPLSYSFWPIFCALWRHILVRLPACAAVVGWFQPWKAEFWDISPAFTADERYIFTSIKYEIHRPSTPILRLQNPSSIEFCSRKCENNVIISHPRRIYSHSNDPVFRLFRIAGGIPINADSTISEDNPVARSFAGYMMQKNPDYPGSVSRLIPSSSRMWRNRNLLEIFLTYLVIRI